MELSKNQRKKQKRKERAKDERKLLRSEIVLCLTCAETNTLLEWKHNGYQCPGCKGKRYMELT